MSSFRKRIRRAIARNTGTQKIGTLKKGNLEIALDPTINAGEQNVTWYTDIPVPEGNIVIVGDNGTTPSFYSATIPNALDLINRLPARKGEANFANLSAAMEWLNDNGYIVKSNDFGAIIPQNLVLYYDPTQLSSYPGTGTKMFDLSGNNNHATIYNGPTIVTGSAGYIEFDGSNDYLYVPRDSSMDGWNSAQTIIMWFNHNIPSGRRNPWNQAYGGYGTWTHEQGNNINNYFGDAGSNTQPYVGLGSSNIPKNTWVMVSSTRNTSQHKWYLNTTNTHTYNHSYGTLTTDNNNVTIGTGYAGYWQGKMGKVMAFDSAKSQDEIKQIFYSDPLAYHDCKTADDILTTYPELAGVDGYYWVWPDGTNPVRVYCDMTTDGGGWMLVARSHPTTVNYNGTNWGWRGTQIGKVDDFNQAYQLGWETWHNNSATFTEFIFGNRNHSADNTWGPFIYKNYDINYTNFITSNTQQSYSKSVIKTDTSIYGTTSYPSMQNAVGYATSATNSNYYYLRDCCGLAGYGGFATFFNTAYRNSNSRYGSGPWGEDASIKADGSFEQGGTYYGSYLHGGTNQYMIMVR
jgi:hypothetical protein